MVMHELMRHFRLTKRAEQESASIDSDFLVLTLLLESLQDWKGTPVPPMPRCRAVRMGIALRKL